MDLSDLIIYNVSLTTDVFKSDRRKVAKLRTHLVMVNEVFEWDVRKFTQIKGR